MRALRILPALLALLIPGAVLGQKVPAPKSPGNQGSAERGKQLFAEYCASCHGVAGKGDGPVASALKVPPANLTILAAQNKGRFPSLRVMQAIKAGPSVPAHGSAAMPVWGPIFLHEGGAEAAAQKPPQTPSGAVEQNVHQNGHGPTEAEVQLRIYDLMEFIKTLQIK